MKLNDKQQEAVDHLDGPCLVTACPGSGKTRVLTERACALVERGIKPKNILCMTFTNKAAKEMSERICKKLKTKKPGFFIGTFHSLCATFLRKIGKKRGYTKNFTILDEYDQKDTIIKLARELELDINASDAGKIAYVLNYYRDQLEDFDFIRDNLDNQAFIEIAEKYECKCKEDNLIDFSGLIYETIKILEENKDIRDKVQETFKYILVDETQDTNQSQFHFVNLLGGKWNNIMIVGDLDQCLVDGTKIETKDGIKLIENIEKGDFVRASIGKNKTNYVEVTNVYKKRVPGEPIVNIETKSGKKIKSTFEHMFFADYIIPSDLNKYFVYLMYKKKLGFRVGLTSTCVECSRKDKFGFFGRLRGEKADRIWILETSKTYREAAYYEQYYSAKYGLPTWTFVDRAYNSENAYTKEDIEKLFSSVNTMHHAEDLMNDVGLYFDYPCHFPSSSNLKSRDNFRVSLCGDARGKVLHKYAYCFSGEERKNELEEVGISVRESKDKYWRVESVNHDLGEVYKIYEKIQKVVPHINLIEKANFTERSLSFTPASHLKKGINIAIFDGENVVLDEVIDVKFEMYEGYINDLDIKRVHNFIANGVVSHNSIYRWRGARSENIQAFIDRHEKCNVITLNKNYRSTPQIIKVAEKLIRHNSSHEEKKFETDNKDGQSVRCYEMPSQLDEAHWLSTWIPKLKEDGGWDYDDMVVLYRINKMSEPVEQAFAVGNIPYDVIGSGNFYDRKEVKYCLGMLKLATNPMDGSAFSKVCSLIRGLGNVTVGKIEKNAKEKGINLIQSCEDYAADASSQNVRNGCKKISKAFSGSTNFKAPSVVLTELVNTFQLKEHINTKFANTANERIENVEQVVESSSNFNGIEDGLQKYLQRVSLVTASDKEVDGDKVSLMTFHAAKGLEFPIVFMIGVENGILPHERSVADDPIVGIEEERRLCYVGMTRAEKILYITHCARRRNVNRFGKANSQKMHPSQFLQAAGLI